MTDKREPFDCIDVTLGTERGKGDLFPIASFPRGMAAFSAQTAPDGQARFYEKGGEFRGIYLTRAASFDSGDFGVVTFMPQTGEMLGGDERRCEAKLEFAPNFIRGRLEKYKLSFELVPGVYGGFIKIRFDKDADPRRRLLILSGGANMRLGSGGSFVMGRTDFGGDCCPTPLAEYLHIVPSGEFTLVETDFGGAIEFKSSEVLIKFATSFISHEQAFRIYRREYEKRTIDDARADCRRVWEHFINRVSVDATGIKQAKRREMFYTCLYRMLVLPHRFYEVSEYGEPIHIDFRHGGVKNGTQCVGCDLWASARVVLPTLAVVAPDAYIETVHSLLNTARDFGELPQGMYPYDTYSPGLPIEQIFCDAIVKKATRERYAVEMMHLVKEGLLNKRSSSAFGRAYADFYIKNGYLPSEAVNASVSEGLEYCLGDYCFTRAAKTLMHESVYGFRAAGAYNYKNMFDTAAGGFRARGFGGAFAETLGENDCFEGGEAGTEFGVLHDTAALCELIGDWSGRLGKILGLKPDSGKAAARECGKMLFSSPVNLHLPYVYAEMGEREKCESAVVKIADGCFDGGFPCDGIAVSTAAAWYVAACIGLYPYCPGRGDYLLTKPLFDRVRLRASGIKLDLPTGSEDKSIDYESLFTLPRKFY